MLRLAWILVGIGLTTLPPRVLASTPVDVPENIYRGDLVSFPGAWGFQIGKSAIILVSDQQLEELADPDRKVDLSLTNDKVEASLRQVCERAKAAGQRTLIVAFDHFFKQYRPGQDTPRRLTPDMDEYVQRIAAISKFASGYGLGLELSLLSPLEIGPAYEKATGESGLWMHYREGIRNPATGAYSVELWRQKQWVNNKGPITVEDAGVRVFAFHEAPVGGSLYRVVDPRRIVEITDTAQVGILGPEVSDGREVRIQVSANPKSKIQNPESDGLDRVLVVQQYRTPEMDYFSEKALPYLKSLVDKYADAGVKLNALYSDEMHIQQDWSYFSHHDAGEFAMRYVSPGLARKFASLYGEQYRDLAPFMVYFAYGQEDFAHDLTAKAGTQHVFGASPQAVQATALFRARYYHLLQDGVVDLFTKAKHHAEERMGHKLEARAHATWAESPTIDYWRTGAQPMYRSAYEYTSNFVWSDTVHQAAAACADYFKWGDFLTGNGNDHAEGGYADRDYFALALACSTGILNEVPYSYAAHWGMPGEVSRRRQSLVNTFGAAGHPAYGMVQGMQHRDVNVLMLYPIDLVAEEERFGSWTTQYGYANYVTQAKLLERGKADRGALLMAGRRFTTLVALFEPFPSRRLLSMMKEMAEGGGRVVWSGPPPILTLEGDDALRDWQALFVVTYRGGPDEGVIAPGAVIQFQGILAAAAPQTVLTDFLVDRLYPVAAQPGTEVVATTKMGVVGTRRALPGGGSATFLGYRPRDDQARSLGYETRNWFETLSALGAYPPTGAFAGVNDNTEYLSRTGDYLACRFPNGAVAVCRHFREMEEGWPGGFARNADEDRRYMEQHPAPSEELHLKDLHLDGHTVTYDGREAMTFRVENRRLVAFAGAGSDRIVVDGVETRFSDAPVAFIAWAPVEDRRRVPGGAVLQIMAHGAGTFHIPLATTQRLTLIAEGPTPGSRGETVPSTVANSTLTFTLDGRHTGRWLYAVPAK